MRRGHHIVRSPIPAAINPNVMINYKCITRNLVVVSFLLLGAVATKLQAFDVPLTNQFIAMYGSGSTTTVPVDAWTIINFNTVEVDTASTVTTGAGWYFKSPDLAYVQILACIKYASVTPAAGNYDSLAVFKNGAYLKTLAFDVEYAALGFPINQTLHGATIIRCQKDDLIDVRVWHHGPSSAIASANPQESWITISRIN
jgi:hypothetical protein